jgi:drug/metabolite transporter (DMT)-like permease
VRPKGILAGILLSAIGAVGFASKGIFAKALYAQGWNVGAVVTIRALLALPVTLAWVLCITRSTPLRFTHPRAIAGACLAGIACYYVGAMLDFQALTLIDASVERVLLFSYPSMVVILDSVLYRRRPQASVISALIVTYLGISMVVTGLDLRILHGNLAGAGLVLACASTSALYFVAGDRWTQSIGSAGFTLFALTAATACLTIHHLVFGTSGHPPITLKSSLLFAGIVVFSTVIPMLAMAEGVRRLGAPRASVVSTVGPPTTILLGSSLLHEHLTIPQWIGVGLIVGGILLLETMQRRAASLKNRDDLPARESA